jgi:pyridoxine 4-dehydrogenase
MMSTFALGQMQLRRSGYGAMQLASPYAFGPPPDRASAIGVLQAAVAAGVDHIDTAQYYGPGVVNDLNREALSPYPDGLAIVSKVAVRRDDSGAVLPFGIAPLEAREHDPPGTACLPGGPGHGRARFTVPSRPPS